MLQSEAEFEYNAIMSKQSIKWVPTPTFLYRNYLYKKIASTLPKNGYFLDVGAGNGEFLKVLSSMGFTGESLDISRDAVLHAQKQLKGVPNVTAKLGDIYKYKPKRKYDIIFCFETLEHVKDDQLALKKMQNLLKNGGYLVMSAPAHMSEWSKIDEIKGHYRRFERDELIKKYKNTNLKILNIYTYGFPFLWLLRRITGTGKFIKSFTQHLDKDARGEESSIQEEYNPKLKNIVANPLILFPFFKIMDLFIKTDLGLGYLIVAKK